MPVISGIQDLVSDLRFRAYPLPSVYGSLFNTSGFFAFLSLEASFLGDKLTFLQQALPLSSTTPEVSPLAGDVFRQKWITKKPPMM